MNKKFSMDKLYFFTDSRLARNKDNHYFFNSALPRNLFERFLNVWDHVTIVTRIQNIKSALKPEYSIKNDRVSVIDLPDYKSILGYLRNIAIIRNKIEPALKSEGSILLRGSPTYSSQVSTILGKIQKPFAVEVAGDPYDVFAPGSFSHPFRFLFRWWFARKLMNECLKASAVSYVTKYALQKRYPSSPRSYMIFCSDVELNDQAFTESFKRYLSSKYRIKLIFIGSLDQLYKAPDILIRAVHCCLKEGIDVFLNMVGDGRFRPEIESLTRQLNLGDHVRFLGQLTAGDAVRAELDKADLFVLPSKTEGLPRAMIEAMARGLPCIGSKVGGIPELLPPEDMVPPGDVQALASKILEVIRNPERMNRMAERNWKKAHEYHDDILRERRIAFYRYIMEKTEEWQRQKQHVFI